MNLGNNLIEARKKSGLSQEMVAEKLGVSRQTISKWETAETPTDVYQANCLSKIYNLSLDELMNFDIELNKIEKEIENSNEERDSKIDWTKAWGKKYPILVTYQKEVDIEKYAKQILKMFDDLQQEYGHNELNTMLVLKGILVHEYVE